MNNSDIHYLKGFFLLACLSSGIFASAIITPALVQMNQFYLLSGKDIDQVITVYLLGYLIGQLVSGMLGRKYCAISVFRKGIFIYVLGCLVCIYSVSTISFPALLIGRFLSALGISSGLICSIYLINTSFTQKESQLWLSHGVSSYAVAMILSVSSGGYMTERWSWDMTFPLLLVYGLFLYFLSLFIYPSKYNHQPFVDDSKKTDTEPAGNFRLIAYSLAMGLFTAVGYCYFDVGPMYSMSVLNISPITYSYWNLFSISGILISSMAGRKLFLYNKKNTILYSGVIVNVAIFFFYLIHNHYGTHPLSFFTLIFILFFLSGIIYPIAASGLKKSGNVSLYRTGLSTFINLGSALMCLAVLNYVDVFFLKTFLVVLFLFSAICIVFFFFINE